MPAPAADALPAYPTLLSPVRLGPLHLRNRLVMGSMHTRLPFGEGNPARLAAFYAERARGGVAMIITGGVAPNAAGRMEDGAAVLDSEDALAEHRQIVAAVHDADAAIVMQILHAGRYAKHAEAVGPSNISAPINPVKPRRLSGDEIENTINDYAKCAALAQAAGYDGVDVMGSEGYLINEFTARRTNDRSDAWGGSAANRMRLPVQIIRRMRARVGAAFAILYRISALDLVEDGATVDETLALARALQDAGADALSTGIGWHESRVPTIAYMVPRGAWRFAAARLKRAVAIPVVASNRINTPALAEEILRAGDADLIALARPLLADPAFVVKAQTGRASEITPCIACNQACLDHIFSDRAATCLVNPRAGREFDYISTAAIKVQRIAVAGAGAAGIVFTLTAAARGHHVTLFDAAPQVGGQLEIARRIPGKQEFAALLAHYRDELARLHVDVRLSTALTAEMVRSGHYDRVVVATGVVPRKPRIDGIDHRKVAWYPDVLNGAVEVGRRVAIIGAGAIAFDTAEFLTAEPGHGTAEEFHAAWGVETSGGTAGSLTGVPPLPSRREVHILQRSAGRPAARLGISTGWIVRTTLKRRNVAITTGCTYRRIDDAGLHYASGGENRLLEVDNVVICAGQESVSALAAALQSTGVAVDVIGGARNAVELDAQRAIDDGYRLGLAC